MVDLKSDSKTPRLILASTSKYRQALMKFLDIPFEAEASPFDEEPLKSQILDPMALAAALAEGKALAVLQKYSSQSNLVVIGGDQVAALTRPDGSVLRLGKAKTPEKAFEQLSALNGKTHQLMTAIHICSAQKQASFINVTHLKMSHLTEEQLWRYIELDQPLDCAGSYKIESYGASLFEEITCTDFSAIQGLPLLQIKKHLADFGFSIFQTKEKSHDKKK